MPSRTHPHGEPWLPEAWTPATAFDTFETFGTPGPLGGPVAGTPSAAPSARPTPDPSPDIPDGGRFVAGWDVAPLAAGHLPGGRTAAVDTLDALLPDLARPTGGRALDVDDAAWATLVADAADEREARVRLQLEAAFAEELAAHEAAHADALEQAWGEGHAAGRLDGEADARAALVEVAGALDAAAMEVRTHEERWAGDLRAHIAALAVAVAQHVIGREMAADDGLVVALAARAAAEFPAHEALVARVHPDDLDTLKAAWAGTSRATDVRWIADGRVARGGALLEGRERIVDGRVDAALERLYRVLAGQAA